MMNENFTPAASRPPSVKIAVASLQVDLRGIPSDVARATASNLGPAVHRAVAAQLLGRHTSGIVRLEKVAPLSGRVPAGADSATVADAVAAQIAGAIGRQLPSRDA